MQVDILIKNGHVLDPRQNIDEVRDIGVVFNRIADISGQEVQAVQVIDAAGCYVFPGLIDFHAHIFYRGTANGVSPDFFPATGVTAAVDAGSSGCLNFPVFHDSIIAGSAIRVKAFLSCYSLGLGGAGIAENFDPALFDKKNIARVRHKYPEDVLGLKLRLTKSLVNDIVPLQAALELAEELGETPVCVHVTNPPCPMEDIARVLRKGDILCHMYHGTGNTILGSDGGVLPEIREARARGVIFDMCNGKTNFSHAVSLKALEQGFYPDIISTDAGLDKLNYDNRSRTLAFIMSKYISYGMKLPDIIRCVTETPARLMGLDGRIGTLAPGAYADISIFKLTRQRVVHYDKDAQAYAGNHLLIPQMTITDGEIAFGQIDFNLWEEDKPL